MTRLPPWKEALQAMSERPHLFDDLGYLEVPPLRKQVHEAPISKDPHEYANEFYEQRKRAKRVYFWVNLCKNSLASIGIASILYCIYLQTIKK